MSDPLLRSRIFFLKYEDLIGRPERIGAELMKFIGLDFESEQVEFYKNKEVLDHSRKSEFWKNLSRPIDASNKGNYRKSLSKRQIRIFESVAWNEMHALGYQPDNQFRPKTSLVARVFFKLNAAVRRQSMRMSNNEEMKRHNSRRDATQKITGRSFWK